MIKFLSSSLLCLFLFFFSSLFALAFAAPSISFDPSSASVNNGSEITINVKIDVETNQSFGADASINYDASGLDIVSIANGGFYDTFSNANGSSKIELHGYQASQFSFRTGNGNLAIVKFKGKKDSGSSNLTFNCTSGGTTQIYNDSGSNILSCSNLNQATISYTAAGGGGGTPTPTNPPSNPTNPPNNPTATPKITPKPTLKPTTRPPITTSSPEPSSSEEPDEETPTPLGSPEATISANLTPSPVSESTAGTLTGLMPIFAIGGIILVFAVIGFFLLRWVFAKPDHPEEPPSTHIPPYPQSSPQQAFPPAPSDQQQQSQQYQSPDTYVQQSYQTYPPVNPPADPPAGGTEIPQNPLNQENFSSAAPPEEQPV